MIGFQTLMNQMARRLCPLAVWVTALMIVQGAAHAKLVEEVIKVPVKVANGYGKQIAQDIVVTVFHDDTVATLKPILIVNHGRAVKPEQRAAMGRVKYTVISRWFTRMGFMVALPMRVGYGESAGEDVEDTGDCGRKNYPPGYDAAAVQTLAVLDALWQRPDAAKGRAVVTGQSFGGSTAVTVAAKNPTGVQATINFAGGGGGDPQTHPQSPCGSANLEKMFATYGKTARVPTLWIYTENDQWMGPKYPREWFDAFKQAGGNGEFVLYPPHGKDGHGLFSLSPETWQPRVLEFLKANGYPDLQAPGKP